MKRNDKLFDLVKLSVDFLNCLLPLQASSILSSALRVEWLYVSGSPNSKKSNNLTSLSFLFKRQIIYYSISWKRRRSWRRWNGIAAGMKTYNLLSRLHQLVDERASSRSKPFHPFSSFKSNKKLFAFLGFMDFINLSFGLLVMSLELYVICMFWIIMGYAA